MSVLRGPEEFAEPFQSRLVLFLCPSQSHCHRSQVIVIVIVIVIVTSITHSQASQDHSSLSLHT
jgi:hypothetical protein